MSTPASLKDRMAAFKRAADLDTPVKKQIEVKAPGKLKSSYQENVAKEKRSSLRNMFSPKKNDNNSNNDEQQPKSPRASSSKRSSLRNIFSPKKNDNSNEDDVDDAAAGVVSPGGTKKRPSVRDALSKLGSSMKKVSIKSPLGGGKKKLFGGSPPPKSLNLLDADNAAENTNTPLAMILAKLQDKSLEPKVKELVERIATHDGFPVPKRISVRHNDIVADFTKVQFNNPSVTEISIEGDPRFAHISQGILLGFADGIRDNLHLKKLKICGVDLGNEFLSALANSLEYNFTLEEIDLQRNAFTNDGMVEFCQSLGPNNDTVRSVNLRIQHSPIFDSNENRAIEALEQHKRILTFEVDFKSKTGRERLDAILERNKTNPAPPIDSDARLIDHLEAEAERAVELWEENQHEEDLMVIKDDDWDYLYKLSQLFDTYKLDDENLDEEAQKASPGKKAPGRVKSFNRSTPGKSKSGGLGDMEGFTPDGAFLTEEFITKYLVDVEEPKALWFEFGNQFKMFKRFPPSDKARPLITKMFVDAIVDHPRANEITGINMSNSCCGNDFLECLSERCLADPKLLPNLNTFNLETNFLGEGGIVALAKCLSNQEVMKYLQVLKLENQRALLSSKAELKLSKAMSVNRSVVRFSLRLRNLLERQQINKYIQRNIDFLRQARRHHKLSTGTLEERKRNEMEQLFDSVAANDKSITELKIVHDIKFMALNEKEKVKAGAALTNNTHLKSLQMDNMKLDDKFAIALGQALPSCKLEKLLLDSNAISGEGMKALFEGLGKNNTIIEMQVRHQSKPTSSEDEEALATFLDPNELITKLGVDIRGQLSKIKIDKIMARNREIQRKKRVAAKKAAEAGETAPEVKEPKAEVKEEPVVKKEETKTEDSAANKEEPTEDEAKETAEQVKEEEAKDEEAPADEATKEEEAEPQAEEPEEAETEEPAETEEAKPETEEPESEEAEAEEAEPTEEPAETETEEAKTETEEAEAEEADEEAAKAEPAVVSP
jgi:hypothetical protein